MACRQKLVTDFTSGSADAEQVSSRLAALAVNGFHHEFVYQVCHGHRLQGLVYECWPCMAGSLTPWRMGAWEALCTKDMKSFTSPCCECASDWFYFSSRASLCYLRSGHLEPQAQNLQPRT